MHRLLRSDLVLVAAALTASGLGALLVHSATRAEAGSVYLVRHLLNLGIGLVLALLVLRLDRAVLRALAPFVYAVGILGLALVLTPLGSEINGSRSWIQLPGGFSIQPSELAKVGLCVALPMLLAPAAERRQRPRPREVLLAGVVTAVPVLLVMAQPDLGSALVLVALALGVLVVSGAAWPWLVGVLVAVVTAVTAAFTTPLLSPYQRDRLTAFLDPSADPLGIGYQTQQVRAAIAGGGWGGQGLHAGELTGSGAIPFQETDFVFSVAGEELGFVGAAFVVVLLGLVVGRVALAGTRTDDPFVRLVCWAVSAWFAVQSVENIGMNLGLLPVTGLPLPFLSYGGSSMFACWAAMGLVVAVSHEGHRGVHYRSVTLWTTR
ncbi:FtsW/RodA/SpoVE family cell cycle protein [Janibacter terrae]|uniref:FtsW/RodA/SpoVE family cell cycle protein n=1 Tax=Janibacter terrae TaxID=103817 RepID=UPI000830675C|nr:FtsW/RodA/SpoVE family cell cycle protein [Janibacter terrae]MBA4083574.1 rod shape-determining protein RodA [Kytococcus sp.]HBO53645.1 rod shape-determining protein RodA [Janibacter terrae]